MRPTIAQKVCLLLLLFTGAGFAGLATIQWFTSRMEAERHYLQIVHRQERTARHLRTFARSVNYGNDDDRASLRGAADFLDHSLDVLQQGGPIPGATMLPAPENLQAQVTGASRLWGELKPAVLLIAERPADAPEVSAALDRVEAEAAQLQRTLGSLADGFVARQDVVRAQTWFRLVAIGAFDVILFGAGLWFASRQIVRPIHQIWRGVQRLQHGDFSRPVAVSGRDELAMLANALNGMSNELAGRARLQQELVASETRFRALIERGGDAFLLLDADGKMLLNAPANGRILGYKDESFIGRSPFEFVHPDDLSCVRDALAQLVQHPETEVRPRFRTRHNDGSWRWLEAIGRNWLAEPNLHAITVNYRDITDRKLAELALRASEDRFQAFMDNSPLAVFIKDERGRYVYGNQSWAAPLKKPVAELLGRTDIELWPEAAARQFHESDTEVLTSDQPLVVTQSMTMPDGSRRDWLTVTSVIHDAAGQRLIGGQSLDITERKRASETLEITARRLNTLLEIGKSIASTLDLDELLNVVLDRLVAVIATADLGVIYLYDPNTNLLVPEACVGYNTEALSQVRLTPGESISGRVFQTRQRSLSRTVGECEAARGELRPENARLFQLAHGGLDMRSNICVPLTSATGDPIGTISLGSTRESFDEEDLSLLEGVAGHAALAIENVRLLANTREAKRRYRSIFENAVDGIYQSTDDGRFLAANPALARILGYESPEQLIAGLTSIETQLYVNADRRFEFKLLLEERNSVQDFEIEAYRKDGSKASGR